MTEEVNEVIASLNINKILIAILETVGEVRVSTLNFLENTNTDKELVIDYEEDPASFVFKLRSNNE